MYSTPALPAVTRLQTRTERVPTLYTTQMVGPVQEIVIEEDDQGLRHTVTRTATRAHAAVAYSTQEIVRTRTIIDGGDTGGVATSTVTKCA